MGEPSLAATIAIVLHVVLLVLILSGYRIHLCHRNAEKS